MKCFKSWFVCIQLALLNLTIQLVAQPVIIDHSCRDITIIPGNWIDTARTKLHVAYGHTSHGAQIIEGLRNLDAFMQNKGYAAGKFAVNFNGNGSTDELDFYDYPWHAQSWPEYGRDLGSSWRGTLIDGDYQAWFYTTRKYLGWIPGASTQTLDDYANGTPDYDSSCNVVIWSWCGQMGYNTLHGDWSGWNSWNNDTHKFDDIFSAIPYNLTAGSALRNLLSEMGDLGCYLYQMSQLETDYPGVKFIFMTGHVHRNGLNDYFNKHNEIVRQYCHAYNKILYDFADIESYDPDGNYFGDKYVSDACNYDADGNGQTQETDESGGMPKEPVPPDRNWAVDWQNSHTLNVDWYECRIQNYHTQHVNDNLKAYAIWWLLARLAGWNSTPVSIDHSKISDPVNETFTLFQNYPNPFNAVTEIRYRIKKGGYLTLVVYDITGKRVAVLKNRVKEGAGSYHVYFNADRYSSGLYYYQLTVDHFIQTKKMLLLR